MQDSIKTQRQAMAWNDGVSAFKKASDGLYKTDDVVTIARMEFERYINPFLNFDDYWESFEAGWMHSAGDFEVQQEPMSLGDRLAHAQTEYEVALETLKALRLKCDLSEDGEDEFNVALADVQSLYHEVKKLETLRAWS